MTIWNAFELFMNLVLFLLILSLNYVKRFSRLIVYFPNKKNRMLLLGHKLKTGPLSFCIFKFKQRLLLRLILNKYWRVSGTLSCLKIHFESEFSSHLIILMCQTTIHNVIFWMIFQNFLRGIFSGLIFHFYEVKLKVIKE